MHDARLDDELALRLEHLHDLLVSDLDVLPLEVWDFVGEQARSVDWTGWDLVWFDDTVGDRDAVIVITKGGRLVDDTGTRVGSDIRIAENFEGGVLELGEVKVRGNRSVRR